jgi:hypothetical protein
MLKGEIRGGAGYYAFKGSRAASRGRLYLKIVRIMARGAARALGAKEVNVERV